MQEVYDWTDAKNSPVGRVLDVSADLASHLGRDWQHYFGEVRKAKGGVYGNGLVTNAKILDAQPWTFAWDANNQTDYGDQPRGAIAVKLDFGGRVLWLVNVHLAWENAVAMRQVWQVLGGIKTFDPDYPVIAVGDFNIRNRPPGPITVDQEYADMAAAFQLARFKDVSGYRPTALMPPPVLGTDGQLDYVFVYDPHERLTLLSCDSYLVHSGADVFTDHLALVADFRWN